MLYRDISRILAFYLFGFAGVLLIPLALAIYYQYFTDFTTHPQPHTVEAFVWTIITTLAIASCCHMFSKGSKGSIYQREGIVLVVLLWLLTPLISAFPFIFSGTLTNPFQAYFETMSGLTTTGLSCMQAKKFDPNTNEEIAYEVIIPNVVPTKYTFYGNINPVKDPDTGEVLHEGIEAVSKALLFWRSMTNWLGGIGIVVLFVMILPMLGVGGKLLFQTEVAGPSKEGFTPRVTETAITLFGIYCILTFSEMFMLLFTNPEMPFLDAITISFSTIATGGFSIKNESIGAYHNVNTEIVVMVFMALGSINFALYYYLLMGKIYKFYNTEFFLWFTLIILFCSAGSYLLIGAPDNLMSGKTEGILSTGNAFREGCFQIVSSMSCCGFATANYDLWPYSVQMLMVMSMYIGGMAGSTAGGIKTIRHYMLFKISQYKVESLFRPSTVRIFRVDNKEVDTNAAILVLCFFLLTIAVSVGGTLLYVLDGLDLETAFGLVACNINGVGLAFRMAGPTQSAAFLSDFGLVNSSLIMLFGRLEYFTLLAVLIPSFWKQNS